MERRGFLKMGAISALFAGGALARGLGSDCAETPEQTSGPFYPKELEQFTHNNDLTTSKTVGQLIYIRGHVLEQKTSIGICAPIANAEVEIWQACASGKYNNKKDPNPAALDPNFKYWGEVMTDVDGGYLFKTIIPGAYPASKTWDRPPHIHFKVAKLGYHELTTQMYFKGDKLNDKDLVLLDTPEKDRRSLIVEFAPVSEDLIQKGFDPKALIGEFNLTLRSVT